MPLWILHIRIARLTRLAGEKKSHWKWPDIQGLHEFQGDLVHSANWPQEFNYDGKRVAVIGNGSSGIQIVPAIQKGILTGFFPGFKKLKKSDC